MYIVESSENTFDIRLGGKYILKGVRPVVTLEDGTTARLDLKKAEELSAADSSGCQKECNYQYSDSEEKVSVNLKIKDNGNMLAVYVDAEFKNEFWWDKLKTFAPVGSVKLAVDSIGKVDGLMANYMFCDYWTRPFFKKNIGELPAKTQSLLWNNDKDYFHLLPVCGDVCRTDLAGNGSGMDVVLSVYTGGCSRINTLAFILGAGDDPFGLSAATVAEGMKLLGSAGQPRTERRYPEVLEYLGWCSWDAFYGAVDAAGLIKKAEEFNQKGLPVKWMIIDDGWSETKDQKLMSFSEDKVKFPQGLKGLIEELKKEYGVKWVGVWHAFTGYWKGVHPESELAKDMKEFLYTTNAGNILPHPDSGKGFMFWNAWHSSLRKKGVDFVKVDNQSSLIKHMKNNMPVGTAAKGAHQALEASVGINFDSRIINCMGMASEQLWHRPISSISRNSDDFYPKKANNFKDHILQNAYNSFYHSNFVVSDWDMWWTKHPDDTNHSVLRAVSGGPVYASDPVGETDPDKLWPLIMSDGRILRCDLSGMPAKDCLTINPNEESVPLKVWNRTGKAGVIAAFNVNLEGNTVKGSISSDDVPGLEGDSFAVYEYFSGSTVRLAKGEKLDITLENGSRLLYILVPVEGACTPVGLLNKYISPAAIKSFTAGDKSASVVLKDGGIFGFVCDNASGVIVNNKETAFTTDNGMCTVDCSAYKGAVHITIMY